MAVTGSYSLKWHGHSVHLNSSIARLYCCNAYTDVILTTTDGNYVAAHQFVLSACSPYLHNIFTIGINSSKNNAKIVVVLPSEIRHSTLSILLQYIYKGEAIINQDQLPSIMKAAELLQIAGLYKTRQDCDKNTKNDMTPHIVSSGSDGDFEPVKPNPRLYTRYNSDKSESLSVNANSSNHNTPTTAINRKTPNPSAPLRKKHKSNEIKKSSENEPDELMIEKMIVGEEILIKDEPIDWDDQRSVENDIKKERRSDDEETRLDVAEEDGYVPLTCDVCQCAFATPALWVRHIETKHPASALAGSKQATIDDDGSREFPPLHCDYCQEVFTVPADWVKHIKTHEDEQLVADTSIGTTNGSPRRVECSICKKTFHSYASMQVHVRTHTGERPFICQVCGRQFSVKSNYIRHLRTLHDQSE